MNKSINIAVVGLGQVGSYLLNELNTKKKDIELKTGKKINIVAISKKRKAKIEKKKLIKKIKKIKKKKKKQIEFKKLQNKLIPKSQKHKKTDKKIKKAKKIVKKRNANGKPKEKKE
jgi:homoserine dehydrogenase